MKIRLNILILMWDCYDVNSCYSLYYKVHQRTSGDILSVFNHNCQKSLELSVVPPNHCVRLPLLNFVVQDLPF